MRINNIFLCSILLLLAWNLNYAQTKNRPHHIGARVNFVDYGRPNGYDSLQTTNAIEVLYFAEINRLFNIAVSGKAGVANVIDDINNRTYLGADLLAHVKLTGPESSTMLYLLGGGGMVNENIAGVNVQFPVGVGFNYLVGKNAYLSFEGQYRVSRTENRSNLNLAAGFLYNLGGSEDADKDGIADDLDQCPNEPGPAKTGGCPDSDQDGLVDKQDLCPTLPGTKELNGCPDSDGDGVTDADDYCPDVVGDMAFNGCPDTDGDGIGDTNDKCPDIAGPKATQGCPDADRDGVPNSEDLCPNQAGTKATRGCPSNDADNDGVADNYDQCPNTPGLSQFAGCPDSDADRVPDNIDKCPNVAGEYNGCPDSDGDGIADPDDSCPDAVGPSSNKGCPELKEEVKQVLSFAMQGVQFETGEAILTEDSYGVLDQILDIMNQYSGYSLSIEGHTDSVGEELNNQILSEDRAKTCYLYLIAKGIAPTRLSFAGYGETKPITDNDSSEGRKLNRRVEFNIFLE